MIRAAYTFTRPNRVLLEVASVFAASVLVCGGQEPQRRLPHKGGFPKQVATDFEPDACTVASLQHSQVQGLKVFSPQGDAYLINQDDSKGVSQLYVVKTRDKTEGAVPVCITCSQQLGGPNPKRNKMQPAWSPDSKWIFTAVERDKYSPPPILGLSKNYVKGQLENGIWTNMWAVSPDGETWRQLTNFQSNVPGTPDGYTGPAITPDGKTAVWSQVMDGNILVHWPFGRWALTKANIAVTNGAPALTNLTDITPQGMVWNEPGNFAPDNESLVLTGSTEKDAEGMDQYVLDIRTGKLMDLTNSPAVWDEHGVFSPDGRKILFMSAYPYRSDPKTSKALSIKTEFMLMNSDGSRLAQLTHFRTPGYPEYSKGIAANGIWSPDGRSLTLRQLFFPRYVDWTLTFQGACGNAAAK
jgi:Tol biopolymer transport system component